MEKYYVIRPRDSEQGIYLRITAEGNTRPDISEVVFEDGTQAMVLMGTKSGFENAKRISEQR